MKQSDTMLRLIALFKLFKAALLIVVGLGALKLIHRDIAAFFEHWVEVLRLDPHSRYIGLLLEKVSNIAPNKIAALGLGSLIYAGLFLTEGTGLWFEKRWAEWLTVIITSSLVPIELYEIYRHPTPVKIAVLLLNIAIVVYLVYRIRNSRNKNL
jgi:uncharacterized membrane protein (DUF2068 family)